mmetsp:Transcript_18099/g.54034  ORF Transcript_18099/g.54034 Transcript_18099/m.54034 type:complete len:201 (+) Transcript_18099:912-1514(+)
MADLLGEQHRGDVHEDRRQDDCPHQRLEGLFQTIDHEPQLLQRFVPPDEPRQSHQAGDAEQRHHPQVAIDPSGVQDARVDEGDHGHGESDEIPDVEASPSGPVVVHLERDFQHEHQAKDGLEDDPMPFLGLGVAVINLQANDDCVQQDEDAHGDIEEPPVHPGLAGFLLVLLHDAPVGLDDAGHALHLLLLDTLRLLIAE